MAPRDGARRGDGFPEIHALRMGAFLASELVCLIAAQLLHGEWEEGSRSVRTVCV